MSNGKVYTQVFKITLGRGIGVFIVLLIGMSILITLSIVFTWFSKAIPSVAYLAFGFIMNRFLLRGLVEWHPLYNTLDNVSGSKLSHFIFWPIAYPVLFCKLGITKYL